MALLLFLFVAALILVTFGPIAIVWALGGLIAIIVAGSILTLLLQIAGAVLGVPFALSWLILKEGPAAMSKLKDPRQVVKRWLHSVLVYPPVFIYQEIRSACADLSALIKRIMQML